LQPVPAIKSPPSSAAPRPTRERKKARIRGFIDRRMPELGALGQISGAKAAREELLRSSILLWRKGRETRTTKRSA
jgi:hypothetical protein